MFVFFKSVFIEDVVDLMERLFVLTGLLSLAAHRCAAGISAAVSDDLVDGLHRALGVLAPFETSRHATGSGAHTRSPILSINDMYRVEAPNVECAVKLEVRDAMIMETVPEVVHLFHPLELALLDLERSEAGEDMLLGEAGDWQQATK